MLKYLNYFPLAEHKPKSAHFRIGIGVDQDHLTNHVPVTRRQKKTGYCAACAYTYLLTDSELVIH